MKTKGMGGESKSHPTINIPCVNVAVELRWLSLGLLIFQNTLLVLAMRFSRTNNDGPLYLTSTAVIAAEFLKVSSCVVILRSEADAWSDVFSLLSSELANVDTLKVSVPGFLYLVQNNLLFVAVSNLDAAVYQVTYQLKILTTAFFTVVMLGRHLQKHQMGSLLLLTGGVAVVQLAKNEGKVAVHAEDQNPT
jgi:UDP-sugar transporter A1/2/3